VGQYFRLVNKDREEFAETPIGLRKLFEWGANFAPRLFLAKLLNGRWKGDRIALLGDYNEKGLKYYELDGVFKRILRAPEKHEREAVLGYHLLKEYDRIAPVYYNPDLNEYVSFKEMDGDKTNALGALLYLTAFSYEKGERIPDWRKNPEVEPSRWAWCRIIPMDSPPENARSISKEALEVVKEDGAFRTIEEFKKYKEIVEREYAEAVREKERERQALLRTLHALAQDPELSLEQISLPEELKEKLERVYRRVKWGEFSLEDAVSLYAAGFLKKGSSLYYLDWDAEIGKLDMPPDPVEFADKLEELKYSFKLHPAAWEGADYLIEEIRSAPEVVEKLKNAARMLGIEVKAQEGKLTFSIPSIEVHLLEKDAPSNLKEALLVLFNGAGSYGIPYSLEIGGKEVSPDALLKALKNYEEHASLEELRKEISEFAPVDFELIYSLAGELGIDEEGEEPEEPDDDYDFSP